VQRAIGPFFDYIIFRALEYISTLSEELEVNKQIIAPQILSVSGGNPYKLVEEMEKSRVFCKGVFLVKIFVYLLK
jgi:hypothetical protein